jgi:hypothetical protein
MTLTSKGGPAHCLRRGEPGAAAQTRAVAESVALRAAGRVRIVAWVVALRGHHPRGNRASARP